MNKIIKASACMLLTVTLSITTFMTANAAATSSKNNTGNSVKWKDYINLSLNKYSTTMYLATDRGSASKVSTKHTVELDYDEASVKPYNSKTNYNLVYWYSEWRANDGKGKIKDSYEKWLSVKNNKNYSRCLSDNMGLWTWDSDITYCRYDICPLWNPSDFDSDGEWDPSYSRQRSDLKSDFYSFKKNCSRRASTDITH